MAETRAPVQRPISPHLSIYKPMLTMMMSIVHRITGGALYFGTLLLAWWLIAAASGPNAYAKVQWFMGTFIGQADPVRLHLGADPSHVRRHPPFHLGHRPRLRPDRARMAGARRPRRLDRARTIVLWIVGYAVMGGAR